MAKGHGYKGRNNMIYVTAFFTGWFGAWYALTWYPGFGLAALLFAADTAILWAVNWGKK